MSWTIHVTPAAAKPVNGTETVVERSEQSVARRFLRPIDALKRSAFERPAVQDGRREATRSLILRATADGWSLVGPNDKLVFRGLGMGGRRQCLEFAREQGVLWLRS